MRAGAKAVEVNMRLRQWLAQQRTAMEVLGWGGYLRDRVHTLTAPQYRAEIAAAAARIPEMTAAIRRQLAASERPARLPQPGDSGRMSQTLPARDWQQHEDRARVRRLTPARGRHHSQTRER
jgi:hypothetical protein